MRYVILIWAYALLSAVSSFAQPVSNKDVEAIYKRQADFLLKYSEGEGAMPVKLKASYDHKEKTYDVKLVTTDGDQDLLQMYDPLSYEYFYAAFYDSLKKKTPHIKPISQMATQSVFTWLYTLSAGNEDDIVNAGTLWLKNCAMIFGTGKDNKEYEKVIPRERFLDSMGDRLGSQQRALAVARKDAQSIFAKRAKIEIADTVDYSNRYSDALLIRNVESRRLAGELEKKADAINNIKTLKNMYNIPIDTLNYEKQLEQEEENRKPLQKQKVHLLDENKTLTVEIDSFDKLITDNNDILVRLRKGDTTVNADSNEINQSLKTLVVALEDKKVQKGKVDSSLNLLALLNNKIAAIEKIISDRARIKSADDTIPSLKQKVLEAELQVALRRAQKDSTINKFKTNTDDYDKYYKILNEIGTDTYASDSLLWKEIQDQEVKLLSRAESLVIKNYFDQRAKFTTIRNTLTAANVHIINGVSLQFERGYLERIQVWVSNGYGSDIYENVYAIGMSSINNLKAFNTMRLFIRKSSTASGSGYYIKLSDVVGNYDNFLSLFTRDYSPADTEINNVNPMSNPCLILRKERLINLFDTKIYTDFAGLKEGSPNGLVQLDACRRFNVNNHRIQVKSQRSDFGFFDNITVFGAITKIEQEQKRLPLRNSNVVLNNKIISPSYATTLDLRQYENASLGTDMNVALFDYPDGKFTMFFNVGLRYAHTPLEDSARTVTNNVVDTPGLATNLDAHSFTWQPKLSMEFFAERRVGLVLTYQYNIARFYTNNEFKPIVSYAKSDPNARATERNARYYHMYELFLRIETSRANNGRMFLRARYFKQQGDANTFFPQVQLGYAYNLVFRK